MNACKKHIECVTKVLVSALPTTAGIFRAFRGVSGPLIVSRAFRIMPKAPGRKLGRARVLGRFGYRAKITQEEFRDARVYAGLTREQAADLVGVSLRTIGHWETGAARPTYAAFKLLRVLRHGDLVDPGWAGYSLIRGKLVSPEGHTFSPSDMAWWSLTVRMAHAFRDRHKERLALPQAHRPAGRAAGAAVLLAESVAVSVGSVVVSGGRNRVKKNRISGLPSSNRGVSETERLAPEAVNPPPKPRAAALPKAGAAAQPHCGGAA